MIELLSLVSFKSREKGVLSVQTTMLIQTEISTFLDVLPYNVILTFSALETEL